MDKKIIKEVVELRGQHFPQEVIAELINKKHGLKLSQKRISQILIESGMRTIQTYSKGKSKPVEKVETKPQQDARPKHNLFDLILDSNLHDSAKVYILRTLKNQQDQQKGA